MTNTLLVFNRKPYFDGAHKAKMAELAQWVKEADKVISF
jgi:sulfur relay (sulfurtransferase) complex TusBCD TusD component (DsrE family)